MTAETAIVERWSAEWQPPSAVVVRGTVVLLPGRGEPASAYVRLGERLAADGYRVLAVGSDVDPDGLRRAIRADPGPRPVVLIGADTGAATALALSRTAVTDGIAAVVLAGLPVPGGTGDARTATASGRTWDEELDARTACPVHRRRLSEDRDVVRGALWSVPVGPLSTGAPSVPVLALHGELDVISPPAAVGAVLGRASGVRLVVVAGGRHDVLNDVHHRSVAAEIVQFLERLRLSPDARPILRDEPPGSARDQSTVER